MTEHALFVYGILRQRATVSGIIQRRYEGQMREAILVDHTVRRDLGPAYCFPCPGEAAEGLLIDGLTDADVAAIDRVEGTAVDHYRRVPCQVLVGSAAIAEFVAAEVYLGGAEAAKRWASQQAYERFRAEQADEDPSDFTDAVVTNSSVAQDDATIDLEAWLASEYTNTPPSVTPTTTYRPTYAGSAGHLPHRSGVGIAHAQRQYSEPAGAKLSVFVYDQLRSLDRLELAIDREWFGRRIPAAIDGFTVTSSFPPFALPDESEGACVYGHLLSGFTPEDLEKLDSFMNVASGFYRRIAVRFGRTRAFIYVGGRKAELILQRAQERSQLAKLARQTTRRKRKQTAARHAQAKRNSAVSTRVMTDDEKKLWGSPTSKVSWRPSTQTTESRTQ